MKLCKIQLSMIRGAIGKRFVVKHYKGGKVVVTKYPNMKGIVPSEKQKVKRRLFKRAVQYAQKVFANPALKEEKRRMLRRPRRLFQALMKEWFRLRKEKEWRAERRIERWRRRVRENGGGYPAVKQPFEPTYEFGHKGPFATLLQISNYPLHLLYGSSGGMT